MADLLFEILLQIPLISGLVWLANGAWPWFRGLRTSPERAFVAGSLLLGMWALLDWVFLNMTDMTLALLVSQVRLSVFCFSWLAFLYFGRWLSRTRSWIDYALIPPVIASVVICWTVLNVRAPEMTPLGYPRVFRDVTWYSVFLLQTATYIALAFTYIGWDLSKASFSSQATRHKLEAIFAALVITMAAWLSTNAYNNLTRSPNFPALSSILLAPGFLVLLFLSPGSTKSLLAALRRASVTPARPFAAIWFHNSGQPLAQVVLPGEAASDAATLSDLSREVDHVLVEGPGSNPGTLHQLEHESHSFVFEKGHHVTLVILVRGRASESLRSEMRTALRGFEADHKDKLGTWEAASTVAEQALDALDEVITPRVL